MKTKMQLDGLQMTRLGAATRALSEAGSEKLAQMLLDAAERGDRGAIERSLKQAHAFAWGLPQSASNRHALDCVGLFWAVVGGPALAPRNA